MERLLVGDSGEGAGNQRASVCCLGKQTRLESVASLSHMCQDGGVSREGPMTSETGPAPCDLDEEQQLPLPASSDTQKQTGWNQNGQTDLDAQM